MISLLLHINNIYAISITSSNSVAIGKQIKVTVNFGTSIGAYDSIQVTYNNKVLKYVSGDPLYESLWWDSTADSKGITSKSYVFEGIQNGVSEIHFSVKSLTSANSTMDYLGDLNISKVITVGSGIPKGDIDKNGVVDANDAAKILEIYKAENATKEDITIADMDDNGILDSNDAALVLETYKTNL